MNATPPVRPRWGRWWALASGWWILNGAASVSLAHQMRDRSVPLSDLVRTAMTSALLWIPITVAVVWLTWRWPAERGRLGRSLPIHGLGLVGVVLLRAAVVAGFNRWIGWYETLPGWPSLLLTSAINNSFLYVLLAGVTHAAHFAKQAGARLAHAERLEAQLAQSQLAALQAQLRPHFLFNALHAISSLVHSDPGRAETMIARLSELLRQHLSAGRAQEIPLEEELALLAPYLEIERMRFGERLQVRLDVGDRARSAFVPSLLLQPLVENAIRHGISRRSAAGVLAVRAECIDDRLRLTVRDDGPGWKEEEAAHCASGVGLSNTRARLQQLYGARQSLSILTPEGGGCLVTVELPLRDAASMEQVA